MEESPGLPGVSGVSDPALLIDTSRCPACFTPLATTVCARCGLDIAAQGAHAVLTASQDLVRAIGVRDRAIAAMRAAQADRPAAPATPTMTAPSAAPATATMTAPPAAPAPPPAPPAAAAAPTAPAPRPRRSGVQILLLVAGVIAVSVAAVFFALVAVLFAPPPVRAGVLAAAAMGVLAGAVPLHRRLPSTGEGVAVLGLVMLLLDLLLIRTAFALTAVDPALYAGLGLAIVGGIGAALGRRAGLRSGSVSAAVLAPPAVALIVGGAPAHSDHATAVWLGAVGAMIAGSAGLTLQRRVESVILRAQGLCAALIGLTAAVAVPVAVPGLHLATVGSVAVLAGGWLLATVRQRPIGATVDRFAAVGLAAVAAVLAVGGAFGPALGPVALLPVVALPPIAAAVAAVRLGGARRTLASAGAAVAGITAALLAIPALIAIVAAVSGPFGSVFPPFAAGTRWAPAGPVADFLIGSAGLAALLAAAGVAARRRGPWTAAAATAALGSLATAAATGTATVLLPVAVLLGAACVAAIARLDADDTRTPVVLVVFAVSIGTIGLLSVRGVDLWPVAALAAAGLSGALRIAAKDLIRTAIASAVFVAALLLTAATALPWAQAARLRPPLELAAVPPFVVAGAVLLVVALRGPRIAPAERVAVEAVAVVALLGAGATLALVGGQEAAGGASVGLALVALATVPWLRRPDELGEPAIAGITGPPVAIGAAVAAGIAAQLPPATTVLLGTGAVLVVAVAALGLVADELRPRWEAMAAVSALAVAAALPQVPAIGWTLPLIALAAAATLLAFRDGDPFLAGADRRIAGWTAIGLLQIALWRGLIAGAVTAVEPYTLPAAGALLAIAIVAALRSPRGRARAGLAVTGAALAILPSTLATLGGPSPRDVVVALVGAAAAVLSIVAPERWREVPVGGPLAALGATALGLVALVAGGRLLPGFGAYTWTLPAAVLLAVVTAVLLRRRPATRRVTGPLVAAAAVAGLIALDAGVLRPDADVFLVLMVVLLGAQHVAALLLAPARPVQRWTPIATAALATVAAVVARFGTDRPLEAATVPLGVALLAGGVLRMRRDPATRSRPALGPGLAVLLLPSLALDAAPAVTWRVVGLGVVALAVLVVGATRQLSAPFLLGGAVFVVHVLAQLWPWIQQVYLAAWWLWIGLAGALLIAIAARYERRVRDLRQAVRLLGAQR